MNYELLFQDEEKQSISKLKFLRIDKILKTNLKSNTCTFIYMHTKLLSVVKNKQQFSDITFIYFMIVFD